MNGATTTERSLGVVYNEQLLEKYHEINERLTLNALVMLCLAAREFNDRVKFIVLDDSDQGPYQCAVGLLAAQPLSPGEYAGLDLDEDSEFDDEGWAGCLDDRATMTWQPFCLVADPLPLWRLLDVDKVLTNVALPWRPTAPETGATWGNGHGSL